MLGGCLRRLGRLFAWVAFRGSRLLWPPAWTQGDLEIFMSFLAISFFFFLGGVFYMFTEELNPKDPSDIDMSESYREKLIQEYVKKKGWQLVREDNIYAEENVVKPDGFLDEIEVDFTQKPRYKIIDPAKERAAEKRAEEILREEKRQREKERDRNRIKKESKELAQFAQGPKRRNPMDNRLEPAKGKQFDIYKKHLRSTTDQPKPPLAPERIYTQTGAEMKKEPLVFEEGEKLNWLGPKFHREVSVFRTANSTLTEKKERKEYNYKMAADASKPPKGPQPENVLQKKNLTANDIKMSRYKKVPKILPNIQGEPALDNIKQGQETLQKLRKRNHSKPKGSLNDKGLEVAQLLNKQILAQSQDKNARYVESQKVYVNNAKIYDLSADIEANYECLFLNMKPSTKVCLYPVEKDVHISYHILKEGNWEPHIVKEMQNELYSNPEIGLIDIGANIGMYTLIAANMGHPVLAVEPYVENIRHLHMAAKVNNATAKVTVLQNAISDERRRLHLRLPSDNQGGGSVVKGESCPPGTSCVETDTLYMDDLVKFVTFSKAIMKVDIEGHENRAFRKAEVLFDRIYIASVYMEWRKLRSYYGSEVTDTEDKSLTFDLVGFFVSRDYSPYCHVTGARLRPGLWYSWPDDIVWRHQLSDVL